MPTLIEAIFDRIILPLNLIATTVVFYVATRIYLFPHLARLQPRSVLIPILLLHSLRHLGMMFLTRGAIYPGLPPQFAYPAALGDLLAAVLAFTLSFLSFEIRSMRDLWYGFSMSGARSIYSMPLFSRRFAEPLYLWAPLTGFPRFGCPLC